MANAVGLSANARNGARSLIVSRFQRRRLGIVKADMLNLYSIQETAHTFVNAPVAYITGRNE